MDRSFHQGTTNLLNHWIKETERAKEIPGGALVIHHDGDLIYEGYFGFTSNEHRALPVNRETLFDLASLTKPIAGVPLGLEVIRQNPDRTEWVMDVLGHRTDIKDDEKYQATLQFLQSPTQRRDYGELLLPIPVRKSNTKPEYLYSNTAYFRLSLVAEAELQIPYSVLDHIFLQYPGGTYTYKPNPTKCATTGIRSDGSLIVGRPYDPLADAALRMQELPPLHSGLFASAVDVSEFGDWVMQRNHPLAIKINDVLFSPTEALTDQESGNVYHVSTGGLLSDTQTPFASYSTRPGRFFHQTGYTGCLLWFDVQNQITVALLSNASLNNSQDRFPQIAGEMIQILIRGSLPHEK